MESVGKAANLRLFFPTCLMYSEAFLKDFGIFQIPRFFSNTRQLCQAEKFGKFLFHKSQRRFSRRQCPLRERNLRETFGYLGDVREILEGWDRLYNEYMYIYINNINTYINIHKYNHIFNIFLYDTILYWYIKIHKHTFNLSWMTYHIKNLSNQRASGSCNGSRAGFFSFSTSRPRWHLAQKDVTFHEGCRSRSYWCLNVFDLL